MGGKNYKCIFLISAKILFSSFLYNLNVLSKTLKSNMRMMMMMAVFPVTVSACCLCCLNHRCVPAQTCTPPSLPRPPASSGVPVPPDPDQFSAVNKAVLSVYTHTPVGFSAHHTDKHTHTDLTPTAQTH